MLKYSEYVQGQTEFTRTVKAGLESQTKATEDVRLLVTSVKDMVRQNQEKIDADMAMAENFSSEGSTPARELVKMMTAASELMRPVPKLREEQNRLMVELLGVQQEVLKTLQNAL